MVFKKTAQDKNPLTAYAQAVLAILKHLGLITLLLTIPTTAILLTQQDLQQLQIYQTDSERTAVLTVDPERSTVIRGELFTVKINLDPGGTQVTEAQAVLRYDQDLIHLDNVYFPTFAKNNTVDINNDTGRAVIRSFFDAGLASKVTWFEAVISTHGEGTANFWFDCRRGATDETNVIRFGGGDIVNCNNLGQGWFTVNVVNRSVVASPQPASCDSSPAAPSNLSALPGPGRGEVTLRWNKVSGADHYTVTYGKNAGAYEYGSPNIGDTDQFVVKGLIPGQRYYLVITAVNNCGGSSAYSGEVNTTAGYGAITKTTYDYTGTEKGFQPPIPPEFLPEKSATGAAEATPSSQPTGVVPSPSPVAEAVTKPWQRLDFWLLAGGIALGGLFLVLLGSLLGRGGGKDNEPPLMPPPPPPPPPAAPAPIEPLSESPPQELESALPPSPWDETVSTPAASETQPTSWPPPENKSV